MSKKSSSRKPAKKNAAKAAKKAPSKTSAKPSGGTDKSHEILLQILKRLDLIEAKLDRLTSRPATAVFAAAGGAPAAAVDLPNEVNNADDVEAVVITITERRTGVQGVTRDTSFADDLGLTSQATKGLFIPIRDAIIARGRQIQGFTSSDFASNDTVGEAVDALAAAIPGLDE
jgi:hypothetical protein